MTIQVPDRFVHEGRREFTWSCPFEPYYENHPRPEFGIFHTGLYRGYVTTWAVEGDTPHLTAVEVVRPDGTTAGLTELFPGQREKVEVSWFSGEIWIHGVRDPTAPRRKRDSTAPRRKLDRVFRFRNGKLIGSELHDRGPLLLDRLRVWVL
jgi:hypothetical protein